MEASEQGLPLDRSPEIGELVKALAAARKGFGPISKEKTAAVKGTAKGSGRQYEYNYKYASLDAAIEATADALADHGLVVLQPPDSTDGGSVIVETLLAHESGQWLSRRLRMPCGPDPQSVGSAITYARRYAYLAILNLAPADDDDGQRAQQSAQREQEHQRSAKVQRGREIRERNRRAQEAMDDTRAAQRQADQAAAAEDESQEPPTWSEVWDVIRTEYKRVADSVEPLGHDQAINAVLPEIVKATGWSTKGVERVVGTELDVMVEDLPRVDGRRRPFAMTWIARALKRFAELEILAEYDQQVAEAADDGLDATGGGLPANAALDAGPDLATILDRVTPSAEADFPGEDEGAAWEAIAETYELIRQHHPAEAAKPVHGKSKMAIYASKSNGGRTSGDAERLVVSQLGLDAFAELPEILAPAVAMVLAAFPAGGTAKPTANGSPPDGPPEGWQSMGVKELGTLIKAMVAQGKIPADAVPESLDKAGAVRLVEGALERQEGGAS